MGGQEFSSPSNQFPFSTAWLIAKITGLIMYIVLGIFAMKTTILRPWRIAAFLAALSIFAWIMTVARFKSPWGFLIL